jgi:5'-deoxynucleotidase YfbR-like HD superfamily hydrolase
MTIYTPSSQERTNHVLELSDRVYETIDQDSRDQRILSLGIHAAAQTLENSYGFRVGGDAAHSIIVGELRAGGLSVEDKVYDVYPTYRETVKNFGLIGLKHTDPALELFTKQYGAVERATFSRDGRPETDARHAVHLAALALPYAAEHYPDLEQSKIALYSLIHDAPEAYAGDVPTLGISDEALRKKEVAEALALETFRREFHSIYPKLVRVVENYENKADDEARYVKTFDKLDPKFTHIYTNGKRLIEHYGQKGEHKFALDMEISSARIRAYGLEFDTVHEDREELTRRVIAATWPE